MLVDEGSNLDLYRFERRVFGEDCPAVTALDPEAQDLPARGAVVSDQRDVLVVGGGHKV